MPDPDLFQTEQVVLQDGPYDGQEWEVRVREQELHIPTPPPMDGSPNLWPHPYQVYRRVPGAHRFRFVR